MKLVQSTVGAALTGALSWTAAEYGLHRFAMHEMRGRGMASREHLKHHADVTYFSPTSKKLLSAAATTAVAFPAANAMMGRRWATTFTTAMITTYSGYEMAHRRTHTHPPRNEFGRWMRRSHLHHHFGAPMRNFGVTSPVWDHLLGTYDHPGVVTVPQRMAPIWMIDTEGCVRPEFAADYIVKAGRRRDVAQAEQDRSDAFTNIAPAA
ncbi:MAG: sterol desaturase family protein [Candidatus Microthrix sp.]|jgi:sterol desaturase/sphingolipid hydroxylase (fatty acid hydroxylase superfamily)|nr:sterol desaturase family protein [Candidatus Microthrix sp.]